MQGRLVVLVVEVVVGGVGVGGVVTSSTVTVTPDVILIDTALQTERVEVGGAELHSPQGRLNW